MHVPNEALMAQEWELSKNPSRFFFPPSRTITNLMASWLPFTLFCYWIATTLNSLTVTLDHYLAYSASFLLRAWRSLETLIAC
jgi:hypothetical protein